MKQDEESTGLKIIYRAKYCLFSFRENEAVSLLILRMTSYAQSERLFIEMRRLINSSLRCVAIYIGSPFAGYAEEANLNFG